MHHKRGFTLIEMLIVLSVISLSIFIVLQHATEIYSPNNLDDQIKLLTSKIDYYQSRAIKEKQTILMVFRPSQNNIRIVFQKHHKDIIEPLSPLHLDMNSNLYTLSFNSNGEIMKFGRINFKYRSEHFSIVFHIEQGRYRVIKA
ncbi:MULTISPECIES: competence type IV pilus minor pilin ComGD [unclassified Staphylococcus]|uniref:competence type IV pilus minor pilin ComGD n=1 Tax=unclassified Staphylococcus TaxID=91994 RepID=UPI0021D2A698|nr:MULTISPECIES: competence type IV pilus minor pilin ComGD [unclassified Staphylococcus]UXR79314.1 prepilin-type N-terminal cleavage/methylation domain-containing protein [Staphylococcus sp. IVB6227]UXR81565.1 prepilin-type N-terminal cleavage/methylation domain-containing protein [Staphylococcus sp. IVB6214]